MELTNITASMNNFVSEYQLDDALLNDLRLPTSLAKVLQNESAKNRVHEISSFEEVYIEVVLACYEVVAGELAITAQQEICSEISESENPFAKMLGVVESCPHYFADCIRIVPTRVAKRLGFELSQPLHSFTSNWACYWDAMHQ
jgi:hypothetical protein